MNNIINRALKFYSRNKRRIDPHLVILGLYLTTKFIFRRTKAIISTLSLQQVDIANRYGKGSYALITGGAGGIGREFALDLARKGFNLIIVDFNQAGLDSIQQEIKQIKSDLMVKTILIDFSQGDNADFYKKFQQEISKLDISILINNVGTNKGSFGIFDRLPMKNIIEGFNINFVAPIMVTQAVINQMLLRNKYQSLILNLSSASSYHPFPYFFGYGSSKVGMANFFDALALELRNHKNIDILTLKPYYVSTAMIRHRKGLFIVEPQKLVQSTWKYVGRTNEITPNCIHQFKIYLENSLPTFLRNFEIMISHKDAAEAVTQRQE
ncbi:unnamed protein product [Paramecium primaurelia]|uniref:Uncharacterized protein n=1 Tax=Paramecium primaurelia TaxID=5886 RepID=A0A8S1MGC6_PARPR|nr:unnamed protein product [Paramecium primaurelia]